MTVFHPHEIHPRLERAAAPSTARRTRPATGRRTSSTDVSCRPRCTIPTCASRTTITLRFDPRMLSRIKRIARRRYLNYQSMIKQWLSERMENEMKD